MWGLDTHGLRVITEEEASAFVACGAANFAPAEFTFSDLFLAVFPTLPGKKDPMSRSALRRFAGSGALRWGPEKLTADELDEPQVTNQGFCVLSLGKRQREMVIFNAPHSTSAD